jgi:hypothetical protein
VIASLSHFFVFIHIPKNAGTSVHFAIKDAFENDGGLIEGWGIDGGVDLAHPFPDIMKREFPQVRGILDLPETRSFAILRDPVSRCIAAFNEHRFQYANHPDACKSLDCYLDAIEAKSYLVGGGSAHIFIHGAPQAAFLFEGSRCVVKTLFRMDDPLALVRVNLLAGRPLTITTRNRVRSSTGNYLNREQLRRIIRLFEEDYELIDAVPLSGTAFTP